MTTDIAFLRELHDDLMEAAALQTAAPVAVRTRPVATRGGRRWPLPRISLGRRPVLTGFALALMAFVLIATGLGYLAQRSTQGPNTRALSFLNYAGRQPGPVAAGGVPRTAPVPQPSPAINGPWQALHSAAGGGAAQRASLSLDTGIPLGGSTIAQQAGTPSSRSLEIGPLIVKTAELSVQVKRGTFDHAYEQASVVADHFHGYIEASSTSGDTTRSGMLRIRIPAGQFDTAVASLRAVGHVDSQSVSGRDVTANFVDLQSRLKTWQAQENSLLALIAKATTVQETLNVQRVLQNVQLEVEQLKGQIRLVNNQTANGTVTVYLHEQPPPKKAVVKKTVVTPSLGTGLHKGIKAFFGMLVAFMVGVGYLLPMLALLMVAILGWVVVRRVRRVA